MSSAKRQPNQTKPKSDKQNNTVEGGKTDRPLTAPELSSEDMLAPSETRPNFKLFLEDAERLESSLWLRLIAYSLVVFGYLGAMSLKNWTLDLPRTIIFTVLSLVLLAVFSISIRFEPVLPLRIAIMGLETALIVFSTFLLGFDYSLFFTLLPLFLIAGQAQIWLNSRYAMGVAFALAVLAMVCLTLSPVLTIQTQFFLLLSLMVLPLVFTTLIFRFVIREHYQRINLAETIGKLQSSEMRYRMVTDRANDAIFIISPETFLFVNPKMERLSGYTADELKDMHFIDLLTSESQAMAIEALHQLEQAKSKVNAIQVKMRRKDGALLDIEMSGGRIDNTKNRRMTGLVVIARDITERLRLREQTARRNRDLSALNTVVTAGQSLEIDKILNEVVNTLVEVIGADMAGINLIEEETKLLKVAAYRSGNQEEGYTVLNAVTTDGKVHDDNLSSQVVRTGKPILVNDLLEDPRVTNQAIHDMGLRSFLAAPIINRDKVLGVLNLIAHQPNAFGQDDLNLLSSIGSSIAVAIENARLYSTSQNQVRELTCLADIARAINLAQSLGETLTCISESISLTLGYSAAAIFLLDDNQNYITAYGGYGLPQNYMTLLSANIESLRRLSSQEAKQILESIPIFRALFARQPRVTLIENRLPDVLAIYDGIFKEQGWKTVVGVPLLEIEQATGVVLCYSTVPTPPPESEMSLLQTIANQTVVAVRNAQLYQEQERRADQLRAVSEIGQKISNILDFTELLPYITRLLHQTFDYYNVAVFLIDPDNPTDLVLRSSHGWDNSILPTNVRININLPGIITWVIRMGEPLNVADVRLDERYREYGPDGMVRSELCVPIRLGNRVVGVLDVASTILSGFDAVDLTTMQTLADQVGIALENARLYTQLNQIVNQLTHTNTELEKATRHKSEFLANMSHELRTPLNAIIGFSEILQDKIFGELNQKQDRYVSNILTSGRHLLGLVNDVLDLAKVEAGRMELSPEDFNPDEAVMDVKHIVTGIATKKKLILETKLLTNGSKIKADKSKFKQILYNLLSNAVKFTPEGGTITVHNRVVTTHGIEMLEVAVQDTGIGIKKEDHARIFEEFSQVDSSYSRQYQGTGLGLALCRQLVGLHGGAIWVDSEPGVGSTFTFSLPMAFSQTAPTKDNPPPSEAIDRLLQKHVHDTLEKQVDSMDAGGHEPNSFVSTIEPSESNPNPNAPLVVIIEDDDKSAELLNLYLGSNGYATMRVTRGHDVLPRVRALEPKPSLITLDVLLEKESGWDVLRDLKADPNLSSIPVLVISILDGAKMGRNLGAVDSITKPISKELLLQKVTEILTPKADAFNLTPAPTTSGFPKAEGRTEPGIAR